MALDPKDVGELQKALNDAAGKASVLWTTFVIFQLYLAIAIGSVTHRDLFLEHPIKLPLLNVDLPLVGFFVVAPAVLVIFHFYVFLQLLALAATAKDYNTLIVSEAPVADDRQYLRRRLDSFLVLQILAGPKDQRTGVRGFLLRVIAWITLIGTPVLILLQGQVKFLPYHGEWIVWLQRIAVLIDLMVIWYFWINLRSEDDMTHRRVPRNKTLRFLAVAGSLCVVIFSAYLATFPGEWVEEHLPALRYIPTTWRPHWSEKKDWTSLQVLLFKGAVDEVSGRPRSVFSNRLVLTDQSFVVDPDKLDKIDVSHSFRGRDLRQAMLNRADLRKADFTGAMLNGAQLRFAKLRNAVFGCARTGKEQEIRSRPDGCTWLQGASLDFAQLQGASLDDAQLQGASLDFAQLQGASLDHVHLQGASLDNAPLQAASLWRAQLQGASLDHAELQGALLFEAQLQGASLKGAQLQGVMFFQTQLQGATLKDAMVWRARGIPNLDLTDQDIGAKALKPWEHRSPWEKKHQTFAEWRDAIVNSVPAGARRDLLIEQLATIDPAAKKEPEGVVLDLNFWEEARSAQPQGEEFEEKRAVFLADLACSRDSAPFVARGLLRNILYKGLLDAGAGRQLVAERLRKGKSDPTACPGVEGFTDEDWANLSKLSPNSPVSR